VDLNRKALQGGVAELTVGDDQADRRVLGGTCPLALSAGLPTRPVVAADQLAIAIGDRAGGIDDNEGGDVGVGSGYVFMPCSP